MKKKVLLTCMVMAMLLAFAMPVAAATYGDLTYEVNNGEVAITGCNENASGTMEIPAEIDGYPVTSIRIHAFWDCDSLTSVTIPNSVTYIGAYVFRDCTSLTSVTIADSVTYIESGVFMDCASLTSITVADGNSNYSSSDGVLFNKNKTRLIQYPVGNSRASYVIPDSVTSIEYGAFWGCESLTSITVADGNSNYSSSDGVLFNKDKTKLIQYPIGNSRTSYVIPNSVTSIWGYAFSYCSRLTSVTIPNSVTFIGAYAFRDCTGLTSVTILNRVTEIYDAFCDCDSLTLYGYSGSTTETYAKRNGIPFETRIPVTGVPDFSDVKKDDWFASYVYDLAGRGILNGMTETTFAPEKLLTRAQFAKMLATASGEDLTGYQGKTSFDDVATSAWYAPYVQWACENEIVSGMGDGRFAPEDNVNREQMAAMITRYAKNKGITLPRNIAKSAFNDDASISGWAKDNVYAMQQAGIINGYDDGDGFIFNPQGDAKRSEAAKIVSVFLKLQ